MNARRAAFAGIATFGIVAAALFWSTASGAARPSLAAAGTAPAAPVEYAPDDASFYAPPDPIPAVEHGTLLRFQRVPDSGPSPGGPGVFRILYASTTAAGNPTVISGLVATGPNAPPAGGADVLLYGHGTTGLADICAPSRVVGAAEPSTFADGFQAMRSMTNTGFIVVATDYEGIGGPGVHPMLVGVSEGRSMLDAGRAARQLPGVSASQRTAVAGVSQGGHAAWWATQLAPEWTPEQPILATVLSAAGTEVVNYVSRARLDDQFFQTGAVAAVAGMAAAYPEAAAALGNVLSEEGQGLAATLDQTCFRDIISGATPVPYGNPFVADPTEQEPFAGLLRANTAGTVATGTPMLVLHASDDFQVPLSDSDEFLARVCATGQVVERRVSPGGHDVGLYAAIGEGGPWITAVLGGSPPISSCPTPLPPPPPVTLAAVPTGAPGAVTEFAVDDPAFYTVPDPVPAGEHGQLLRYQRVDRDAVRIMYLSADSSGDPVVATGLVSTPQGEPPVGGYAVLLVGEAPAGLADQCASSRLAGTFGNDLHFENLALRAADKGFVVVTSDGVGIGVPGPSEFLVGPGSGQTLLDAGVAARQLTAVYLGPTTGVTGFGLGGHAALWAAQLAPTWTPSQPITGALLAAPVTDIADFIGSSVADADSTFPTIALAAVAGLTAALPDAAAAIGSILTADGSAAMAALDQHCFDAIDDPFEPAATVPAGGIFAADPAVNPQFALLLAANGFGRTAVPTPMLLFHGGLDNEVPLAVSDALLGELCAAGQVVERRIAADEYHATSATHADTEGLDWLLGLSTGTTTPTSSCPG